MVLDKITVYPPKEIENVLTANISDKLFLSLEVDVFNQDVTTAYSYKHDGLLDTLYGVFHCKRHLSFEQVLDLSKRLVTNKNLLGINISGYLPELEKPPYRTASLLSEYLYSVLS